MDTKSMLLDRSTEKGGKILCTFKVFYQTFDGFSYHFILMD